MTDLYTKVMLTVIAVSLAFIAIVLAGGFGEGGLINIHDMPVVSVWCENCTQ